MLSAILKLSATLLWCYHNTEQGDSNFSVSDSILDTPTIKSYYWALPRARVDSLLAVLSFGDVRLFHKVKHFLLTNKILFSSKFGHPWWQNQDFELKRRRCNSYFLQLHKTTSWKSNSIWCGRSHKTLFGPNCNKCKRKCSYGVDTCSKKLLGVV